MSPNCASPDTGRSMFALGLPSPDNIGDEVLIVVACAAIAQATRRHRCDRRSGAFREGNVDNFEERVIDRYGATFISTLEGWIGVAMNPEAGLRIQRLCVQVTTRSARWHGALSRPSQRCIRNSRATQPETISLPAAMRTGDGMICMSSAHTKNSRQQ